MNRRKKWSVLWAAVLCAAGAVLLPQPTFAHGSVTPDADLCIIRIGYLKAHFKVYLPQTRQHEDFCEDLPDIGDSVFVMEYEHDGLAEAPIDFRIIENVSGQGRFTNLQHIEQIEDLDAVTVFHHPFAIQPDVFTIAYEFDEPGKFVGIVTVRPADSDRDYTAVFPFEAGYTGLGYWPWIIGFLVLLQLNYLWMSGRLNMLRNLFVITLMCAMSPFVQADDQPSVWKTRDGHFQVSYTSELQPIVINRIHNWVLRIVDESGDPVIGATVSVQGGMPAHDHGLPTNPRVTRELEPGRYLLEGLRFHMNGRWEIEISIDAGDRLDVVIIPLTL